MTDIQHRLELRCSTGNPGRTTIHLDGKQLTFVSRVELVLDCNGGGEVKLAIPAALLDLDVDAAAFVTAHADQPVVPAEEPHGVTKLDLRLAEQSWAAVQKWAHRTAAARRV